MNPQSAQPVPRCPRCRRALTTWACCFAHGRARADHGLRFDGRPAELLD